jgi:hypothetical protein
MIDIFFPIKDTSSENKYNIFKQIRFEYLDRLNRGETEEILKQVILEIDDWILKNKFTLTDKEIKDAKYLLAGITDKARLEASWENLYENKPDSVTPIIQKIQEINK